MFAGSFSRSTPIFLAILSKIRSFAWCRRKKSISSTGTGASANVFLILLATSRMAKSKTALPSIDKYFLSSSLSEYGEDKPTDDD